MFAAYRYLNGGGFTADEQKGLTDVWNAEFNNTDYKDNDVSKAVKVWLKKRKSDTLFSSGIGVPSDNYVMYADRWWCAPYNLEYDEKLGDSVPRKLTLKPEFLTKAQSDDAQAELKKLEEVGDAPKFLGAKILEWAKRAPTDKRIPESLYIVYEANGWSKYGCGNNDELRQQIGNLLKKRYPRSDWTQMVLDEEKSSQ